MEDFTESSGSNDVSLNLQAAEDIVEDVGSIIEGISEAISSASVSVSTFGLLFTSMIMIEVFGFE